MTSSSLGSVLAYAPGPASLMLFTPSCRTRFLCRTYFDRADIINEIKSEMAELEAEKSCTPGQIVERLGEPKEMARAWRHVYSALYRDFGCGAHVQRCGHTPCGSYQGGGLSAGRGCSRCGLSDWLLYSAPTADPAFVCACGYPVFYGGKGIVADCDQLYPDGDKGESEIKHDWRMKTGKLLRLWKRRIRLACLSDIRGRQWRKCIFPGTGARWNLAEDGNEQV